MRALIEYVSAILNIKTDSDLVILDMKQELEAIVDISDYRTFIRTNLNHIDVDYLTGFQKFIKLTDMYKRRYAEATNSERLLESRSHAIKLSEKVRRVAKEIYASSKQEPLVILEKINIEEIKEDGEPMFSKFELHQIQKVGGLKKAVLLQRSESGSDPLLERLQELSRDVVINRALGYNKTEKTHHSVAGLIGKTVQAIRA